MEDELQLGDAIIKFLASKGVELSTDPLDEIVIPTTNGPATIPVPFVRR